MTEYHMKIPPYIIQLHLQSYTILHKRYTCAHSYNKSRKISFIFFTYIIYQHAQTFIKLFTVSDVMKNWQPGYTVTTNEWVNCVQPAEVHHFPPVRPCASGCCIIILQYHNATLLADPPPKILKPTNGSLFDLIPLDVLATIDNWLIGLKYHDKNLW